LFGVLGTQNGFNVEQQTSFGFRISGEFVALPIRTYNLVINSLRYFDELKIKGILLYEQNGTLLNEHAHTTLVVKGCLFLLTRRSRFIIFRGLFNYHICCNSNYLPDVYTDDFKESLQYQG